LISKEDSKMPAVTVPNTLDTSTWTTTQWETWGKLVKTWATASPAYLGVTYPWPTSVAELQQQLWAAGVVPPGTVIVRPSTLAVTVLQMSDQHLLIVLPSQKNIQEAETLIGGIHAPDYYGLPPFYHHYLAHVPISLEVKPHDYLPFNNCRVGEYVISYCG
jgi:hypothetical protein